MRMPPCRALRRAPAPAAADNTATLLIADDPDERITLHLWSNVTDDALHALSSLDLNELTAQRPDRGRVASSAADRYDEALKALRLRALYGCGRQAEALKAYKDIRLRLRDELGADPGEDLRRVHDAGVRCFLSDLRRRDHAAVVKFC